MNTASSGSDTSQFISFAKAQMGNFQTKNTLAFIFKMQTDSRYPNFWQIGCVFDTILDYFLVLKEAGELTDGDKALMKQLMSQAVTGYQYGIVGLAAAWYDDWCWWGIAAAKAFDADYEDIFGDQLAFFQTAAIDLWGLVDAGDFATLAHRIPDDVWKNSATGHGIKFTKKILSDRSLLHVGTPKAWDLILRGGTGGTPRQRADYTYFTAKDADQWAVPRFEGGCWQYDLSTWSFPPDDGPAWLDPRPSAQTLGVFQLTLMSGLYLSFACALMTAAKRKAAEKKSGNAWDLKSYGDYQKSADAVVGFLGNWFGVEGKDCLVTAFTTGSLVHERTPTYAKMTPPENPVGVYPPVQAYFADAYWGGDQGLIMGALKQYGELLGAHSPGASGIPKPIYLSYPMDLLMGVFYNMGTDKLANAVGPYLDPSGRSPLSTDDNDYGSGSGIFWRYVLRCCRLDPGFKSKASSDLNVVSRATTSGTNANDWGNELFKPFNSVAAAVGAWYLLK